jgi:hypothetical protein
MVLTHHRPRTVEPHGTFVPMRAVGIGAGFVKLLPLVPNS